jgi:hypothetical protein
MMITAILVKKRMTVTATVRDNQGYSCGFGGFFDVQHVILDFIKILKKFPSKTVKN